VVPAAPGAVAPAVVALGLSAARAAGMAVTVPSAAASTASPVMIMRLK
jgi:hypothetical protein